MHDERAAAAVLIKQTDQLHSIPGVASRLLSLTRDIDYDIRDVVECMQHDPALVAKVLRTVNSVHFASLCKVASLQHAVTLLGHRSLRLVAMTFGLIEGLTRGAAARVTRDFWRRALTMATVARRLSIGPAGIDPSEAYSAGLLADIGVLVLAQAEPTEYAELYRHFRHGTELVDVERQRYGCGHPAVGAALLERWCAPGELVTTVERHHAQPAERSSLETIVQTADLVADVVWTAASPHVLAAQRQLERTHDYNIDQFIDLCRACQKDVQAESDAFGVTLEQGVDCEKLLDQARLQYSHAALESALELDSLTALVEDHSAGQPRRP
jgi:HD-like signal output (HDOD) protein